ncbi:MAG: 2-oxoglutarate dehydrogenase complex dihydrolipoyllysine-residue succinyltransferase [Methyloligellaceae bacterium]
MSIEVRVPTLGESVTEATVGQWYKKAGEAVSADEPVVELETDKVTIEVPAPSSGVLSDIVVNEGDTVEVGALLASITAGEGAAPAAKETAKKAESAPAKEAAKPADNGNSTQSPAVRKMVEENNINADNIAGSGKRGQVLKGDVLSALENGMTQQPSSNAVSVRAPSSPQDEVREERVRMTKLRQTIARRLKESQQSAAMLTTFNEVDMSTVMDVRKQYKDLFEKKHGVKLGFMGFFVKACIHALKEIPAVNAEIDGTDIIYKNYFHMGVAVGTPKGLVVPVVRDADKMGLAEIEGTISDFGRRARDGKLSIDEMQGGTFTISNGGVYGSLMSTPILNAPQSGILGMHKIQERPMVVNGEIVVRPMMYLALSYDHRIVDGKEAVTFLVRVKESLEDPQRLVLDL